MPRFLVKINKAKKELESISVPSSVNLEWHNDNVRAITKYGIKGVWHKGYKFVVAKSLKEAYKKAFGIDVKIK